ncbi:MAG TPA: hypothetical protein VGS21_02970 [Acidimicrobiales bacterium]|nr:hypothetical protein [Acidimicrobiales bacterium]
MTIPRIKLAVLALASAAALAPASVAAAAWSESGSGAASGAATTMPTGSAPSGTAAGTSVTIIWSVAHMANGSAVAGYVVHRYNATNGSPASVGAGCSGVITTTSCTETSVAAGSWVYTDTPVQSSWTGGESASSGSISVP